MRIGDAADEALLRPANLVDVSSVRQELSKAPLLELEAVLAARGVTADGGLRALAEVLSAEKEVADEAFGMF